MVRVKKITRDIRKVLNDIRVLEKENGAFFNKENKTDFNYNINCAKNYLKETQMIVARDAELKIIQNSIL